MLYDIIDFFLEIFYKVKKIYIKNNKIYQMIILIVIILKIADYIYFSYDDTVKILNKKEEKIYYFKDSDFLSLGDISKKKSKEIYYINYNIANISEIFDIKRKLNLKNYLIGWKENYKNIDLYYILIIKSKKDYFYFGTLVYVKTPKDKEKILKISNIDKEIKNNLIEIRVLSDDKNIKNTELKKEKFWYNFDKKNLKKCINLVDKIIEIES